MDSHTQDDGVEVFAKHADEGRVGCLKMVTQASLLLFGQTELTGFGKEQFLVEMIELFGCDFNDLAGVLGGFYILTIEGLMLIDDKGDQTREVTVFDGGYEGFVLAERTGEDHRELRVLDDRGFSTAATRDGLMFGGFTQRGVVIRCGGTPDVGDDRTFGLMDVTTAMLLRQGLVERRIGGIARDDERCGFMNGFDEFESKVRNTFSACC